MLEFQVNEKSPLHRKTLQWAVSGAGAALGGRDLGLRRDRPAWALPLVLGLAGTVLMIVGLQYMALSKGRRPGWDCWAVCDSWVGSGWPAR